MSAKLNPRLMFFLTLCAVSAGCNERVEWSFNYDMSCVKEDSGEIIAHNKGYCGVDTERGLDTYTRCAAGKFDSPIDCVPGTCSESGCTQALTCSFEGTPVKTGGTLCYYSNRIDAIFECTLTGFKVQKVCDTGYVCTMGTHGAECTPAGAKTCTSSDGRILTAGSGYCDPEGKRVVCGNDGQWMEPEACGEQKICAAQTGECIAANPCLKDDTPFDHGQGYCDEAGNRVVCGNDGQWMEPEACGEQKICAAQTGECIAENPCLKDDTPFDHGQGYCDEEGNRVVCGNDGQWETAQACGDKQICVDGECRADTACVREADGVKFENNKGYCDDAEQLVMCEDGTWRTPVACADGQICSEGECLKLQDCDIADGFPSAMAHGDTACRENSVFKCDNGSHLLAQNCSNNPENPDANHCAMVQSNTAGCVIPSPENCEVSGIVYQEDVTLCLAGNPKIQICKDAVLVIASSADGVDQCADDKMCYLSADGTIGCKYISYGTITQVHQDFGVYVPNDCATTIDTTTQEADITVTAVVTAIKTDTEGNAVGFFIQDDTIADGKQAGIYVSCATSGCPKNTSGEDFAVGDKVTVKADGIGRDMCQIQLRLPDNATDTIEKVGTGTIAPAVLTPEEIAAATDGIYNPYDGSLISIADAAPKEYNDSETGAHGWIMETDKADGSGKEEFTAGNTLHEVKDEIESDTHYNITGIYTFDNGSVVAPRDSDDIVPLCSEAKADVCKDGKLQKCDTDTGILGNKQACADVTSIDNATGYICNAENNACIVNECAFGYAPDTDGSSCIQTDCTPNTLQCDPDGKVRVCTSEGHWSEPLDLPTTLIQCKPGSTPGEQDVTCIDTGSYCDDLASVHCTTADEVLTQSECRNDLVCDAAATHTCVECTSTDDTFCAVNGKVCDAIAHICVQCLDDDDCPGDQTCDTTAKTCFECTSTNDSFCKTNHKVCDAVAHICVECTGTDVSVCTDYGKVCDTATQTCVECTATDDSICTDYGMVCDTTAQTCVECTATNASVCTDDGKVCDAATQTCVECTATDDSVCKNSGKVCDTTTQTCVQCLDDTTCTDGKVCNTASNSCVECLSDTDCSGAEVCDTATNTCLTCKDGAISCKVNQGVTQYQICKDAAWGAVEDLPSDTTNSLLSCDEKWDDTCVDTETEKCDRKLLCNEADTNYCRIETVIGNDVAITCNAAHDFPAIEPECGTGLLCNNEMHKCVECNSGDLKCAGAGKYQLCNSQGAWGTPVDIPDNASPLIEGCTGEEPLKCSVDTGSFCNGSLDFNCTVTPNSEIPKSTCGETYACDSTNQVCICNEGDVQCDSGNYKVCRSGNWQTLDVSSLPSPQVFDRMLDQTCTDNPICKITDSYCNSTTAVQCSAGEAPKITTSCDPGYSCVNVNNDPNGYNGNKCVADPVESCSKACSTGKQCVVTVDGKEVCVYIEDFEYTFTATPNNYTDCFADIGPGYRAERTIDRTHWTLYSRGRKLRSTDESNRLNSTQRIMIMSRGEDETLECNSSSNYNGRHWRNQIVLSDFAGGIGVLGFDWRTQSRLKWGADVCNATTGTSNCANLNDLRHVGKLRIFFNDIDTPVAVMPYNAQVTNQRFEIDFRTVSLPSGLLLKDVNKVTIRPEYVEFIDLGNDETLLGQVVIDNIRWSSAEGE